MRLVGEGAVAYGTHVGLFSGMRAMMDVQVGLGREGFAAIGVVALEWSDAFVDQSVTFQFQHRGKGLATRGTGVDSRRVTNGMVLETSLRWEQLSTIVIRAAIHLQWRRRFVAIIGLVC